MDGLTKWDRTRAKFANQRASEAAGEVADSMEVRLALIKRMDAGEITLDEVKAEIARIKRGAKKVGKITRSQAFR